MSLSDEKRIEKEVTMAEQICPTCGCHVGVDAYEKDGVLYCCQSCSGGGQCECGCCEIVERPEHGKG